MTRSDATTTPPTTVRTRRGSRRTLPMPPLGTPEHRAVIEHRIEAYADVTRRFQLTPDEARDTAEGLRAHARRYGLAIPYYLQSWGLGGGGTPTHGLYPDVETLSRDTERIEMKALVVAAGMVSLNVLMGGGALVNAAPPAATTTAPRPLFGTRPEVYVSPSFVSLGPTPVVVHVVGVGYQPGRRARVMDLSPGSGFSTSTWQRDTLAQGIIAPDGTLRLTLHLASTLLPKGLSGQQLPFRVFVSYGQTAATAYNAAGAATVLVITAAS